MSVILGEALNRRSDLQKRIEQLQERLRASTVVQEGDEPPERPEDLLEEFGALCDELERLIARINHTNAATRLAEGRTVTETLARRDVIEIRQAGLRGIVRTATNQGLNGLGRYSRSEIRLVRQVSVSEIQAMIDDLARQRRELDTALQTHNWTTPLAE